MCIRQVYRVARCDWFCDQVNGTIHMLSLVDIGLVMRKWYNLNNYNETLCENPQCTIIHVQ